MENAKHLKLEGGENSYTMRQPKEFFILCVMVTIGYLIFIVLLCFSLDERTVYLLLMFLCGFIVEIGLCIYALLWRGVVEEDTITFYNPFWPTKAIKFCEITTVKYTENRTAGYGSGRKVLTGYRDKKKIFEFYDNVIGFDLLYIQLYYLGKIEKNELKEEFTLKNKKGDMVSSVFSVVLFGGLLIALCVSKDEEIEPVYVILSACFTLFCAIDLINKLLWKVTVNYNTIQIRNSFGKSEKYLIREITDVKEERHHLVLYIEDKKVAKISKDCENFLFLQERLLYEKNR